MRVLQWLQASSATHPSKDRKAAGNRKVVLPSNSLSLGIAELVALSLGLGPQDSGAAEVSVPPQTVLPSVLSAHTAAPSVLLSTPAGRGCCASSCEGIQLRFTQHMGRIASKGMCCSCSTYCLRAAAGALQAPNCTDSTDPDSNFCSAHLFCRRGSMGCSCL